MAFGALESARLACFMPVEKAYKRHSFETQLEVVSLLGNVGWYEDRPVIHAHASVGDYSQRTFSGHLEEATVNPSLEIFLSDLGDDLTREYDEDTGLKTLALSPRAA